MKLMLVQAIKFLLVGLVNSASGLAVIFGLIYWIDLNAVWANVAGYTVGLLIGFVLNRSWTFEGGALNVPVILKYLLAFGVSFSLNLGVLDLLSSRVGWNIYISQLFAVAIYSVAMFLLCRYFVFTNERQRGEA